MSDIKKELKIIDTEKKNEIIKGVRGITIGKATKTQAQNLREYSKQTESIDEILLYLEYQCARKENFSQDGNQLIQLIKNHKDYKIDEIRYLLGVFARLVIIQRKKEGNENE